MSENGKEGKRDRGYLAILLMLSINFGGILAILFYIVLWSPDIVTIAPFGAADRYTRPASEEKAEARKKEKGAKVFSKPARDAVKTKDIISRHMKEFFAAKESPRARIASLMSISLYMKISENDSHRDDFLQFLCSAVRQETDPRVLRILKSLASASLLPLQKKLSLGCLYSLNRDLSRDYYAFKKIEGDLTPGQRKVREPILLDRLRSTVGAVEFLLRNSTAEKPSHHLVGMYLVSANFRGLSLRGSTLREANLDNADFAGADLTDVSFRASILTGVKFQRARLVGVDFRGSNLTSAYFRGADLKGAVFFDARKLDMADFTGTNWREALFNPDARKMLEEKYAAQASQKPADSRDMPKTKN